MNHFLNGFTDELITKEAAHPLVESLQRGGTFLSQKVRAMLQRIRARSRAIREATQPKAVEGARKLKRKSVAAATAFRKTSMSQETLPGVVRQPKASKPSYGTGAGAMVRTVLREAGKPSGQRVEYGTGCGPKYGCGAGKHGAGCGLRR